MHTIILPQRSDRIFVSSWEAFVFKHKTIITLSQLFGFSMRRILLNMASRYVYMYCWDW